MKVAAAPVKSENSQTRHIAVYAAGFRADPIFTVHLFHKGVCKCQLVVKNDVADTF